jgi:sialate O-acetylesterase
MKKIGLIVLAVWLIAPVTRADVTLPRIFADHMVLQQQTPAKVWGWARPGEKISVQIQRQKKSATADAKGNWTVTLDPLTAGGPFVFTVKGNNTIMFTDVLVGEVWLCAGQSNMEWPLGESQKAAEEVPKANWKNIRHFKVPNRMMGAPAQDLEGGAWTTCSPETAASFTAVGYYFAKELHRDLNVPVGLINASWGGTFLEGWMSQQALSKQHGYESVPAITDQQLEKWFTSVERLYNNYSARLGVTLKDGYKANDSLWHLDTVNDASWVDVSFPGNFDLQFLPRFDGTVWFRTTVTLDAAAAAKGIVLHLGSIADQDDTFVNGKSVGHSEGVAPSAYAVDASLLKTGKNTIAIKVKDWWEAGGFMDGADKIYIQNGSNRISITDKPWKMNFSEVIRIWIRSPNVHPDLLFNGMINPIIPYAIKGALWYQGESNSDYAFQYRDHLPELIADWRTRWNLGDFPFYFVQLPNYQRFQSNSEHEGSNWAELRESFLKTLSTPQTGMAVTFDIGDSTDIHPRNKEDVGKRLSLVAKTKTYNKPVVFEGPVADAIAFEAGRAVITFKDAVNGLNVRDRYGYLKGFEIAGADQKFYYARAEVKDNVVTASSPHVSKPVAVRYAWSSNPDGNLFNNYGLPASPFRSDTWPVTTQNSRFGCWIGNMYKPDY